MESGRGVGAINHQPELVESRQIGGTKTVILPGSVEIEFCCIPAGEFVMGATNTEVETARGVWHSYAVLSSDRDFFSELPQHRVVMTKPFWLGKYQVTQEQWVALMGYNESCFDFPFVDCAKRPVEDVTWSECQKFLKALNGLGHENVFELPTEAQWEYACRAGTSTPFSFGPTITPEQVNYDGYYPYGDATKGLNRDATIPVGSLNSPNRWGLHDMHGNVSEWCADWFDEDYYRVSPVEDPKGPETGSARCVRGGSWFEGAVWCRSACRSQLAPWAREMSVGFRVVTQ